MYTVGVSDPAVKIGLPSVFVFREQVRAEIGPVLTVHGSPSAVTVRVLEVMFKDEGLLRLKLKVEEFSDRLVICDTSINVYEQLPRQRDGIPLTFTMTFGVSVWVFVKR